MIKLIKRSFVWMLFVMLVVYLAVGPDVLISAYGTAVSGDIGGAVTDVYGNTVTGMSSAWNYVLKMLPAVPALPAAITFDKAIVWAGTKKMYKFIRRAMGFVFLALIVYLAVKYVPWGIFLSYIVTLF